VVSNALHGISKCHGCSCWPIDAECTWSLWLWRLMQQRHVFAGGIIAPVALVCQRSYGWMVAALDDYLQLLCRRVRRESPAHRRSWLDLYKSYHREMLRANDARPCTADPQKRAHSQGRFICSCQIVHREEFQQADDSTCDLWTRTSAPSQKHQALSSLLSSCRDASGYKT
jgi:hypothetical protein